ncbi:MAG: hypothetical protein ABH815_02950, partial [Candidatus Omnitrophota bacterium]
RWLNYMKAINVKKFLPGNPRRAFYAVVKCSDCGEEVNIRIDRSSDFQTECNAHNPEHIYTIKKEAIGKNCFNLMNLSLALTKEARLLFFNTQACEFVKFERALDNAAR